MVQVSSFIHKLALTIYLDDAGRLDLLVRRRNNPLALRLSNVDRNHMFTIVLYHLLAGLRIGLHVRIPLHLTLCLCQALDVMQRIETFRTVMWIVIHESCDWVRLVASSAPPTGFK